VVLGGGICSVTAPGTETSSVLGLLSMAAAAAIVLRSSPASRGSCEVVINLISHPTNRGGRLLRAHFRGLLHALPRESVRHRM
jgi:hypothetical protein